MNQKDLEKLQKFYALATSECNENEASVAARKYVKMIKRLDVNVLFYKGQKPTYNKYDEAYINQRVAKAFAEGREYAKRHEGLYTKQQMDEEWGRGFQAGYTEGEREAREEEYQLRRHRGSGPQQRGRHVGQDIFPNQKM